MSDRVEELAKKWRARADKFRRLNEQKDAVVDCAVTPFEIFDCTQEEAETIAELLERYEKYSDE